MRRGHPARGGWRGDSQRHFRPRTGGSPGFRPPRPFQPSLLEMPRFPIQNQPRFPFRAPQPDQYHDRSNYQMLNRQMEQRNQDKPPIRPSPWQADHRPPGEPFPPDHRDRYHVNNMGDIDHRQPLLHKPFEEQPARWVNQNRPRPYVRYDDQHDDPMNKPPVQDIPYSGHRPPASDHYEGRGPGIDNSNTFSRSVDDTVDIIRRKLLTRNDPQSQVLSRQEESEMMREPVDTYQQSNIQQEMPPRRKSHRPRQNMKTNCEQIKNKIVHQLFKMDKDRIHKLMDNPNSSTKFDYAINSLISESQNSFNRHLRETAEKSLGCTRNDIMPYNDENDTIYEDTFMKQMQCILDPQDTILLEDIKPIVMAELNKVLQLNDFDQGQIVSSEEVDLHPGDPREYDPCSEYAGDPQSDPQYYEAHSSYTNVNHYEGTYRRAPEHRPAEAIIKTEFGRETNMTFTSPSSLFERRAARKSCDHSSARRASSENRRASVNKDNSFEKPSPSTPPMPYFDVNTEHLSDDDDPFAELDKQYHVAVDHNFIGGDDMIPETSHAIKTPPPQKEVKEPKPHTPRRDSHKSDRYKRHIKQEIRRPSPDLPLEVLEVERKNILSALDNHIKSELLGSDYTKDPADTTPEKSATPQKEKALETPTVKKESTSENKERDDVLDKSDSSNMSSDKSSMNLNSRKRSTDQRPSHRKEKRKKSESSQGDTNKQILNKNIIINLNDCAGSTMHNAGSNTEKHDSSAKSVFNLYFSKGENATAKDGKKAEGSISNYTDKYVKRKETPQNTPKPKPEKKERSVLTSPNHSTPTPTKESNTSTDQGTSKSDTKIKLKPIDMFTDQPKKVPLPIHQAHRNTAIPVKPPTEEKKTPIIRIKPVLKSISKQVTRKHVSTQIFRKMHSKMIQTESKLTNTKYAAKSIQTDPVCFEKGKKRSTDAFERMKEIDMEIQVLLQEKFKLYNSLEAKEATSSMQNLGMTVVDVPVEEKESLTADQIIEEFTNIPEDELAEIALESVDQDDADFDPKDLKKTRHPRHKQKTTPRRPNKKAKTPNISILEKIISDDIPLEDIISLDDLETSPAKPSRVRVRKPTQKVYKAKKAPQKQRVATPTHQQRRQLATPVSQPDYDIKPCCVLLERIDVSKNLKTNNEEKEVIEIIEHPEPTPEKVTFTEEVIEESVNDFHFQVDMLDVSEDIVIGGEEKIDDKESESVPIPITEDIVLDNSQSSADVGVETVEPQAGGCKMYDFSADEDLKHDATGVSGNGDSVLAIEFVEQNFLAACLDGNVYHFNADGQLLTTLRGSNLAVTCLTIVKEKYGTTVYTGSLDSRIRYYDLEDGLEKGPECNVLSPIQTMDRAWDTVFVGTRTGFVLQFECKNNMLIPVSTIKFSDQSILALRAIKEGPRKVLLVAARSENVTIKDAQTGLLLRTLVGPKMTVYTLLYEDGKVYCGTSSNQVQVFDYASGSHIGEHDGGKGAVCLRAAGGLLFAGCYDGCVYVFRSGERRPFAQLRGPGVMLLSLAVFGSKMIVGYKDRSLYIWKIPVNILQEMVLY